MAHLCWSDLPIDILASIFKCSSSCVDLLRCGAVCVSWHKVVKEIYRELVRHLPPLLLMPFAHTSDGKKEAHGLFDVSTRKIHKIQTTETRNTLFYGSARGWLLTVSFKFTQELDKIHILNPFSRTKIQLPPRDFLEPETTNFPIRKVTSMLPSSSTSSDPGGIVITIYRNKIAFCKPSDENWKTIDVPELRYHDIAFFRGQLYAIDWLGNILHCELKGPNPRAIQVASPPVGHNCNCFHCKYLVESSSGQFLMVIRRFNMKKQDVITGFAFVTKTLSIELFELDLSTKEWSEVKSLGDDALFLGRNLKSFVGDTLLLGQNESICVKTRNSTICRANCIYFIDERVISGHDEIGIYDLTTQSFKDSSQVWEGPFDCNTSYDAPSLQFHWITPDLYGV